MWGLWNQLLFISLVSAVQKFDKNYGIPQMLQELNLDEAGEVLVQPVENELIGDLNLAQQEGSVIVDSVPEILLQSTSEGEHSHLEYANFKWPKFDFGRDFVHVTEEVPQQPYVLQSETALETEQANAHVYGGIKWPKLDFGHNFVTQDSPQQYVIQSESEHVNPAIADFNKWAKFGFGHGFVTQDSPQQHVIESVLEAEQEHVHPGIADFNKWAKNGFGHGFVTHNSPQQHVLLSELEAEQEHVLSGMADYNKWAKFGFGKDFGHAIEEVPQQVEYEAFKWPDFGKNFKTVVVTEEKAPVAHEKKFDFPKIQKEVKEVPVYVYRLPPWPEMKKLELPKSEAMKDIPLIMYEFPPLPEYKPEPLPEYNLPKFRIEKYILPPLPKLQKFEMPKMEQVKEIPIVMYEFPKSNFKFPQLEPIKEIPIVVYDLPSMPKMKPMNLPKMPEIKIVRKKLPEIKPIAMPKFDMKLPEIKVVKYQMSEGKPFEMPGFKVPEVKYVKYEMPLPENPKIPEKLPEFKLPEFKVPEFKVPEFKLPEMKPLELPEFKLPEYHHMQPIPYMHPHAMMTVPVPMAYTYPVPVAPQKPFFGDFKSKFHKHGGSQHQTAIHTGHEHVATDDHIQGAGDILFGTGNNFVLENMGGYFAGGNQFYPNPYHNHFGKFHSGKGGQAYIVANGHGHEHGHGHGDVSQVYIAGGDNGFTLQSDNHWLKPVEFFDTAGYDKKEDFFGVESALAHGSVDKEQIEAGFNKSLKIEETSER